MDFIGGYSKEDGFSIFTFNFFSTRSETVFTESPNLLRWLLKAILEGEFSTGKNAFARMASLKVIEGHDLDLEFCESSLQDSVGLFVTTQSRASRFLFPFASLDASITKVVVSSLCSHDLNNSKSRVCCESNQSNLHDVLSAMRRHNIRIISL